MFQSSIKQNSYTTYIIHQICSYLGQWCHVFDPVYLLFVCFLAAKYSASSRLLFEVGLASVQQRFVGLPSGSDRQLCALCRAGLRQHFCVTGSGHGSKFQDPPTAAAGKEPRPASIPAAAQTASANVCLYEFRNNCDEMKAALWVWGIVHRSHSSASSDRRRRSYSLARHRLTHALCAPPLIR